MKEMVQKLARLVFATMLLVVIVGFFLIDLLIYTQNKQIGKKPDGLTKINEVALATEGRLTDGSERLETNVIIDDARPLLIKKYLEKYKSPLVPYSELIFELSETYGFEYYWIVAIAQQESNLCKKIPEGSHNCWGYGIHKNGTLKFDNYELALKSYAEYLKRVYFDKGLNTPELIMKKYCPNSNGSWAAGVRQFIGEIESGEI